ncbi:MAG: hypothetical protein L6Q47_04770 [Ignavibacteriaceae bacterium]|nr:hypothetical protein [Ignavibacteriaceae bacterium]
MTAFLLVLITYSFFTSAYVGIKRAPMILRPFGYGNDAKIDLTKLVLGTLVLIVTIMSLRFLDWKELILYTLSIRIGLFVVLAIIDVEFTIFKVYNGYYYVISKYSTIIALIYFFIYEYIIKSHP